MKIRTVWIILCTLLLAGCGKGQADGSTTQTNVDNSQKDYIYVAEVEEWAVTDAVRTACASEDTLYFTTRLEDGDTRAYSLDIATGKSKPLQLPLQQDGESDVLGMTVDPNGNLAFLECYKDETLYLKTCASDGGEVRSQTDITAIVGRENMMGTGNLVADRENRYYIQSNQSIFAISPEGNLLFELHPNMKYFRGMEVDAEGQVVFLGVSGMEKGLTLAKIDAEEGKIGAVLENISGDNLGKLAIGPEGKLYVSTAQEVYACDMAAGTCEKELSWDESYISGSSVIFLKCLSESELFAVVSEERLDNSGSRTQLVHLKKTPRSEVQQRERITLGVIEYTADLQEQVTYFNGVSEKYQIVVEEYCSNINNGEQIEAAMTRLQMDLASGSGPDLFINYAGMSVSQLADKGILEDLYPYIREDEVLQKADYFESVLDYYSWKGELYTLPESFYLSGFSSRESIVPEDTIEEGMTVAELVQCFASQEGNASMVKTMAQEDMLNYFLMDTYHQYVDWEQGTCNFESKDFIDILEVAAKYGATEAELQERWSLSMEELQKRGSSMYEPCLISSVWAYKSLKIPEDAEVFLGCPVEDGETSNGITFSASGDLFHINAASENKEGAWEFIRCFQLPEYFQWKMEKYGASVMTFPSHKKYFDRLFDMWMETETITDENGEEQEMSVYTYSNYYAGEERKPVTAEEKEVILAMIEHAETENGGYDGAVFNIIRDEVQPFFAGQKSAEEVAAIIQNRAQLYVSENK